MRKMRILLVCTGNTCRSPLAEIIMKDEASRMRLRNLVITSAGTAAIAGAHASENAKKAARTLGLSLSGFRSKPVTERRVKLADLILTMTKDQKQEIISRWQEAGGKTFLISEFSGSGRRTIEDPLGGPLDLYLDLVAKLRDESRRVLRKISRLKKSRHRGKLLRR